MTIASALENLNTDIINARTAITTKGGTVTANGGSSQLATDIATIPTGGTKYGADVNLFLGNVNANGVLKYPSNSTSYDLVFTGVRDIDSYVLQSKFEGADNTLNIKNIFFPDLTTLSNGYSLQSAFGSGLIEYTLTFDMSNLVTVSGEHACEGMCGGRLIRVLKLDNLTTVSGSYAFYRAFDRSEVSSLNLSNLTTVSGSSAFNRAFVYCSLNSLTFTNLSSITGSYAFSNCFASSYALTSLSFPALTSTSFGSYTNQFNNMLDSVEDCTVHFPSNLQSVIGSWSDVISGFGGTNTTVLFDLTATI